MPLFPRAQLTGGSALLRMHALQDLHPDGAGPFSPLVMGSEWGRSGPFSLAFLEDGWAGISGTGEATVMASLRAAGGAFGMVCRVSGAAGFRESIIGIGYARPLSSSLRVGLRMDRYGMASPSSGTVAAWPVDIAISWRAGPNIIAGISVYDPFRVSVPVKYPVPPPRMVRVLMGFRAGEGLGIVAEWEAMERRAPSLALLLSWQYGERIMVRLGWVSGGAQPILMLGWKRKGLRVMLGVGWHPALGGRYGMSCAWSGPKNEGI